MRGSYRKKRVELIELDVYRPPTPIEVIRLITRQNAIDPRLMPTDRHMQRWAVGQGTGLPNPDRALIPRSTFTPLPPIEAIVTDQVVLASPLRWRRFVVLWYRSDCSVGQMVEEFGCARRTLYEERRVVLAYLLGRLTSLGIHIPTWDGNA